MGKIYQIAITLKLLNRCKNVYAHYTEVEIHDLV